MDKKLQIEWGSYSFFPNSLKPICLRACRTAHTMLPQQRRKKLPPLIALQIVGKATIQKINLAYRKKNKPTDVLAFSLLDSKHGSFPHALAGEIFICWPITQLQAKQFQCSIEEELSRLCVHGLLHVFGYDHERSALEEKKMFRLQNKILRQFF